jgi:uncharacterized protein (DUF302 family)
MIHLLMIHSREARAVGDEVPPGPDARRSVMAATPAAGQGGADQAGVVTKRSPRPVADTVERLVDLVTSKGMTVFAVIDQRAEARRVGLELRDTVLVLFGNPAAGTPVMEAAPLAALDLPLKVLVWADDGGTAVSYPAPATLDARYGLGPELAANLAGIDPLTDALVAGPA